MRVLRDGRRDLASKVVRVKKVEHTMKNEPEMGRGLDGDRDARLLDAYSNAVIAVVDAIGPAVIAVTGARSASDAHREGGVGSGVILSEDGLALTNSHVVGGRRDLIAITADGDEVRAKVIGDDPSTDLAVLRLEAGGLPVAEIATGTESPRVGQLVVAVGSPFGLRATVSSGILSAQGRSLRARDGRLIDGVLQHTAALNPGNSGGPLVDSRGRILGINTAIIAMSNSIGFAVSAATVARVLPDLVAKGRVERAVFGIAVSQRAIPGAAARRLDVLNESGVELTTVQRGSAAERAGLVAGEVIVEVGGRIVENPDDLLRVLSLVKPGAGVLVRVIGERGVREVEVVLGG